MKGIICYYSGSGNTKLACEYIKKNISNTDFEMHNIVKNGIPDFFAYDIVGFAAFTDFWGMPQYFHTFFDKINQMKGKHAFVFNTFGVFSGKTLKQLSSKATKSGFNVLTGYSLHTPENFPPMIARNQTFENSPSTTEMTDFNLFISKLNGICRSISLGEQTKKEGLKLGFMGTILPVFPRTQAKKDLGVQSVDEELCTKCGVCAKGCPYDAIVLNPYPIFNHNKCFGCWACYNHCPSKAIFTKKYKGTGHYSKPVKELVGKLG